MVGPIVLASRVPLVQSVRHLGRVLALPRMGSFSSSPRLINDDNQDEDVAALPYGIARHELLQHLRLHQMHQERISQYPMIRRNFVSAPRTSDESMNVAVVSKARVDRSRGPYNVRVLQWNILSQALGVVNDNFARCPHEALDWNFRRYRLVEEIVHYAPDIICLQEVDHFNFLQSVLGTQGYIGVFFPKPDSPCFYIRGNNGPDGCAIFYRASKFDLVATESKVLEIWRVQSNQVALLAVLRVRETGGEVCVATTHLKARKGALLSTLRNEQGKDLLRFLAAHRGKNLRPVILCGDFNAEPSEPVYSTILGDQDFDFSSAYAYCRNDQEEKEPPYTTWKIREEGGECCHTIDYVFFTKAGVAIEGVFDFPTGEDIGVDRVPSFLYPSDHFSLVCDFRLMDRVS